MPKIKFNYLSNISINDLFLDNDNPRISSQLDEKSCVAAILKNNESKMLNLAEDIAKNGLHAENIIVSKPEDDSSGTKWIVRDGNRRIAAIKLLNEPGKAPEILREKLSKITKQYDNFPTTVNCVEYPDENYLVRFLQLKHGGMNDGVGQVGWGPVAKAIYSEKNNEIDPNIKALNLLRWAKENGNIDFDDNFQITTLADRIMSRENLRRIGFKLDKDNVVLIGDASATLNKVSRIISDIYNGHKNSRNLDTADQQRQYIDELCAQYGEGTATQANSGGQTATDSSINQQNNQISIPGAASTTTIRAFRPPTGPQHRKRIFYRGRIGFTVPDSQVKARTILSEINSLDTSKNPLAAAMLLRGLIELSTYNYIKVNSISITNKDDSFAKMIRKCAQHMYNSSKINKSKLLLIEKHMTNPLDIMHINTLNAYMHDPSYHPDYLTLNAFWDEIEFYVQECWS